MALESLCDKQMTRALHLNPQIAADDKSSASKSTNYSKVLLSKEAQNGNNKARNEEKIAKTERRIDLM